MFRSILYLGVIVVNSLSFNLANAQGEGLLIQQYGKSDIVNINLRKWNFDSHLLLNYFNTNDRNTKGKINLSFGGSVRYNFKKSYGLRSGLTLHKISYAYDLDNDTSIDQLIFLSIPLSGRLYPVKNITVELGVIYNFLLSAKGYPPVNLKQSSVSYQSGTFKNSFGLLSAVHFKVWKRFSSSLQYQFQKRSHNPLQRETNALSGLMLGLHYTFLSDKASSF